MYLERLINMEKELRNHPDITVDSFKVYPPLEPERLENIKIDGLRQLYEQTRGFSLEWSSTINGVRDGEDVYGCVRFTAPDHDYDWAEDDIYEHHELSERKQMHTIIDDISSRGGGTYCAYANEQGEVFVVQSIDSLTDVKMSVTEYIEALFISRGLTTLQGALCTDRTGNEWLIDYQQFCHSMDNLFPNTDYRKQLFKYYRS